MDTAIDRLFRRYGVPLDRGVPVPWPLRWRRWDFYDARAFGDCVEKLGEAPAWLRVESCPAFFAWSFGRVGPYYLGLLPEDLAHCTDPKARPVRAVDLLS